MIWVVLWVVLVAGALTGAFFLLRSLWRKARALLAELERASVVLGELAQTAGRLAEEARELERATLAAADAIPDQRSAWRQWEQTRARAAERAERRRMRDQETRRRWRDLSR